MVKSGDIVSFDLISQELWLGVTVSSDDIDFVGAFEIKVQRTTPISRLRQKVKYASQQVLKLKEIFLDEQDYLKLRKAKVDDPSLSMTELLPSPDTNAIDLETEDCEIRDIFDFLDNQVQAVFRRKKPSSFEPDQIVLHSQLSGGPYAANDMQVPVRNLRFFEVAQSTKPPNAIVHFPEKQSSCCNCVVF